LTKKSWGVVKANPALLRFPLFGALAMIVPLAAGVGPAIYLIEEGEYAPAIPLLVVGVYVVSFIGIYFGVALAATADLIFKGSHAGLRDGMAVARSRLGKIAGWAMIATFVGLVVAALESLNSWVADVVAGLFSAAWGLVTFMAVPVIAFEGTGPIETLKRSGSLFKERWAGQVTGNIAIGGLVILLGILPSILLIGVGVALWINDDGGEGIALGAILVLVGFVALALAHLVLQTLRGVFGVALYRFADRGEVEGPFSSEDLQTAVKLKKR
jgi:hypothetical protein